MSLLFYLENNDLKKKKLSGVFKRFYLNLNVNLIINFSFDDLHEQF